MFRGPRGARPSSRHPAIAGASRPSAGAPGFARSATKPVLELNVEHPF